VSKVGAELQQPVARRPPQRSNHARKSFHVGQIQRPTPRLTGR
jgi:hypothetical protein